MGEIENAFIQRLGISVAEVMQRLVTDEVLHEVDARHIHRLLATNDKGAQDVVMRLEQAGATRCLRHSCILGCAVGRRRSGNFQKQHSSNLYIPLQASFGEPRVM